MPQSAELLNRTPQGQWAQSTGFAMGAGTQLRYLFILMKLWMPRALLLLWWRNAKSWDLKGGKWDPRILKQLDWLRVSEQALIRNGSMGCIAEQVSPGTFSASAENSVLDPLLIFIKLCHTAISCLLISGTAWSWNKIHEEVWVFVCVLHADGQPLETLCCRHIS